MHENEYKRLKRKIQTEYEEKIRALDMVWNLASSSMPGKSSASKSLGLVGKGGLLQAVRNALPKISGEFSAKDVEQQMQADNPELARTVKRASLSSTLNRLEAAKELVLVLRGKGKRPTRYRRNS